MSLGPIFMQVMRFVFQNWFHMLTYCSYVSTKCMTSAFVRMCFVRRHSCSCSVFWKEFWHSVMSEVYKDMLLHTVISALFCRHMSLLCSNLFAFILYISCSEFSLISFRTSAPKILKHFHSVLSFAFVVKPLSIVLICVVFPQLSLISCTKTLPI